MVVKLSGPDVPFDLLKLEVTGVEHIKPYVGFVYGSCADGTQTAQSDIDCALFVQTQPPTASINDLKRRMILFQEHAGFQPDTTYPVELFTRAEVTRWLGTVGGRRHIRKMCLNADNTARQADEGFELLKCLLSKKIPLWGEEELRLLESSAWQAMEWIARKPERELRSDDFWDTSLFRFGPRVASTQPTPGVRC